MQTDHISSLIIWIGPVLFFVHICLSPFFFSKRRTLGRCLFWYCVFTLATMASYWPWIGAAGPLYPSIAVIFLFIPPAATLLLSTPIVVLVGCIYHLKNQSSERAPLSTPTGDQAPVADRPLPELCSIIGTAAVMAIAINALTFALISLSGTYYEASEPIALAINITLGEGLWLYWTYRISRPGSLLSKRPIGPNLLVLVVLAAVPAYNMLVQVDPRTQANTRRLEAEADSQQSAQDAPPAHPTLHLSDLRSGQPITLATTTTYFDDQMISDQYAVWTEHAAGGAPRLAVLRFADASITDIVPPLAGQEINYYLAGHYAIELKPDAVGVIDLDTGSTRSAAFHPDAFATKAETHMQNMPKLVFASDRWLVTDWQDQDGGVCYVDLSNFHECTLTVTFGGDICGLNGDTLVMQTEPRPWPTYYGIDLRTGEHKSLSNKQACWMPQQNNTVDENILVTDLKGRTLARRLDGTPIPAPNRFNYSDSDCRRPVSDRFYLDTSSNQSLQLVPIQMAHNGAEISATPSQ